MSSGGIARPTLGFLSANIHIGASRALWPGVLDAADAGGANLICFPGGRLRAAGDEAQRNALYDLVNPVCLDGLVCWTSSLAEAVGGEAAANFLHGFAPLPIIHLASPSDPTASVAIDSYQGMRALVAHLVDVHHYRRVAILRGPEGHPLALERYAAYVDALRASGLEPAPALISPPVGWDRGAEALLVLLDERGLQPGADFQAVVATGGFPRYRATGRDGYRLALLRLRAQLDRQPRTPSGGFWHKLIYPHQMWLDGSYMAAPFLAEYAVTFDEPEALDDVARQVTGLARQTRDPRTGLLHHAWEESRQQRWADPITGCSPHCWSRFKVNPPDGFGLTRFYTPELDTGYVIRDNTILMIPHGYHTVASAPGYTTYYLWFLAGEHRVQAVKDDPDVGWVGRTVPMLRDLGH